MSTLRVRTTGFPARYEIFDGGDLVTTVSARTAQHGGEFDLDGQIYQFEGSAFGGDCSLRALDGRVVASAGRDGLRSRRIATSGRTFCLTRTGFGSRNLELAEGDDRIGRVRRVGRGAEAELSGLDSPAEVFVLVVALAMWQRRRKTVVIGS
ncbi:hypothetical protein [Nocardia nova]|uniref:Uncharacterized protein n=1 Tax=Nocardia nova SH22a TaxID=1415166 RepID=W5THI4_9NOCA|nr:hypothetical protein [Nocardia nova]AHH18815.1 hypothetical protein NONO_c40310 [Nocardia nova SH22a]